MIENIKILQVNLNKSIYATESTLQLAIEQKVDIIAIQEPWIRAHTNFSAQIFHQKSSIFYQLLG